MNDQNDNIYLVDGNSLCYRAYYAIQELSTSRGMPTNAIYGFVNILRKLMREYRPGMMAIVFDTPAPTVRHKKYEDYKIHRKPMPDDLFDQLARIKEVIGAYNIPIWELEGYEADDIIATLAEKAKQNGLDVTIVTGDKDALQLVDDKVKVLSPHTTADKIYGADAVKDKYGVAPGLMVELMALTGDASDNIPGVKGVGPVTAGKLISRFGSVENVYKNIDEIASGSLRKKLIEGKEMAELSRELVLLDRNVPVEVDFKKTRLVEPDMNRLTELYAEFEFVKLLKEVMPKETRAVKCTVAVDDKDVRGTAACIAEKKLVSLYVVEGSGEGGISGIAFSWEEGTARFVPFEDGRSRSREVDLIIREIFEDPGTIKIGYDIKKTICILRRYGIEIKGTAFDVMIADYLIDPSQPKHDLTNIAMRQPGCGIPGEEDGSSWDKKGQGTMDLFDSRALKQGCELSELILRLYKVLNPALEEKHLVSLFRDVEMPLVSILADMEKEGVGIDIESLRELSAEMGNKLDSVTKKIYDLAGEEFNVNSPKQLQTILYERLGLPVTKRTKTGFSTDESVLRKLAASHELPKILLEYREMNKLKTAYYDSILGLVDEKTRRLHTNFNQAVTATGRLSSSEPNLQNIPVKTSMGKEIRRIFVPGEDGKILVAADYSQVELRILAHLSEDERLIEAFKGGEDVHRFTASLIFDLALADVTDRMRAVAKTVNFGIVYGMSSFGLAKDLEIGVEEAQKFIDSYFNRYSGVRMFIEGTIAGARETGFVTTLLNRRRYVPEINSTNERVKGFAERVAVNTPVQGSAADLIKLAMIACYDEFKDTGVKMILQVHDELVFEVPADRVEDTAKKVKNIMENVVNLKVPLKVDIEAGPNWLDMEEIVV